MSVINQMLKDLDSRQRQAQHAPFFHTLSIGGASTETPVRHYEKLFWAIALLGSAFVCTVILQTGNIERPPEAKPAQLAAALINPAFQQVMARRHNTVHVAEVDWRMERAGALSLLFQLSAMPEKPVIEKQLATGEWEFTLPGVNLDAPLPVLNIKDSPLNSYRVKRREDNLVLTLKPAGKVHFKSDLRQSAGGEGASWSVTAIPVIKPAVVKAKATTVVRKPVKRVAVKNSNNVRKPVAPVKTARASYEHALRYLHANRTEKAISELQKVLTDDQHNHAARELLANLYRQSGRNAEASQLLQQGIALDPDYLVFTRLYADLLIKGNQLEQAATALENAAAYAQHDAAYQAMRAAVAQRLARHSEAVAYYMKALELKPDNGSWWMGMAISLETLNKKEAAAGAYATAIEQGGLNSRLLAYVNSRLHTLERIK